MNWVLLMVFAIAMRSFLSVATKQMTNTMKVSATTQSVLFTGLAGMLSLFVIPFFGGLSLRGLGDTWWIAVLMVLSQAVAGIIFFHAVNKIDASVASVAASSMLPWSVLFSVIFLNSHFSLVQAFGIVLLFVAILLAQYQKKIRHIEPAVLWLFLSSMLFAVFQVTTALLSSHITTATYLVLIYFGSAGVIWLMDWKRVNRDIRSLHVDRTKAWWTTLFASTTTVLFFIFTFTALKHAPDRGSVLVLQSTQVVFSVLLTIWFFKERNRIPQKIAAGVLAVIASYLIVR